MAPVLGALTLASARFPNITLLSGGPVTRQASALSVSVTEAESATGEATEDQ